MFMPLSPRLAASLLDGTDHNHIAKIFGEELLNGVSVTITRNPDDF